jgi:RimJ/RimL family protein N-acetyltransferase
MIMPRLETERLLLRPPEPGDAVKIARWLGDYEVAKNTAAIPHPFKLKDAEALIAKAAERLAKGEAYSFAIVHKTTGVLIGFCSLSLGDGSYRLSYWLGRLFWNQGYGTEAVKKILGFAFHDLKAEKVLASLFDDNSGSGHVLKKLGFTLETSYLRYSEARCEEVLCNRMVLLREDFGRKRAPVQRFRPVTASLGGWR